MFCVFCLKQRITPVPRQTKDKFGSFLNMIGVGTTICHSKDCKDVQVTEVVGPASSDICNIQLMTDGEFILDPTHVLHSHGIWKFLRISFLIMKL